MKAVRIKATKRTSHPNTIRRAPRTSRASKSAHVDDVRVLDVHHVHCMFAVSVDEAARARMFTLDHNHLGTCERRLSYCFKLTSHGHHVSALCECGAEFDLTANSSRYRRRWLYR